MNPLNVFKRLLPLFLIAGFFFVPWFLQGGGQELLLWVQFDQETGTKKLSNGRPAPGNATPGQYYEWEDGRLKPESQWRSPLDVLIAYRGGEAGRVEFSHERHFALLGEKSCTKCHDDSVGLGEKDRKRPSLAPDSSREAHGEASLGRFCTHCHDGKTKASDLTPRAPSRLKDPIFTAFQTGKEESCLRCHAPRSHGEDYTGRHGDAAEHGQENCVRCHRGADHRSSGDRSMAMDFREAQFQLMQNPENQGAFQKTLPPIFCAYCHNRDDEAWESKESFFHSERESREREDD